MIKTGWKKYLAREKIIITLQHTVWLRGKEREGMTRNLSCSPTREKNHNVKDSFVSDIFVISNRRVLYVYCFKFTDCSAL